MGSDRGHGAFAGAPLLRAVEPIAGESWVRCVRGEAVREVLREADGSPEHSTWSVLPNVIIPEHPGHRFRSKPDTIPIDPGH